MTPAAKVKRPRERVVPFLRGKVWWARVPRLDADPVQRSLGIRGKENKDVAEEYANFLRWLKARRESYLLDMMATGETPVGPAYRAYVENRLPAFITELRDGIADVDLEPLVARWEKEMERKKKPGAATRANYIRQVRAMIPEGGPFRRSAFTKQRIRDFLGALEVGQPNRYRAALSSFAKFLIFEDVLPINPVTQVPMAKEAEPRTLHLTQDEAKRLVETLPAPYKAFHALMLATGMEVSAAANVRPQDIGTLQVYARGTKRSHRTRTVGIYDRWRWAWTVAQGGMQLTGTSVWDDLSLDASYRALKRALAHKPKGKKAKSMIDVRPELGGYTTHDHRHTWAVQAIKDRLPLPMIASNLGHRDSAMLLKVYGRYAPTGADFAAITSFSATAAIPAVVETQSPDGG